MPCKRIPYCDNRSGSVLAFLTHVGQVLVDSLLLEFPSSSISQIGNERDQTAHVGVAAGRTAQEAGSCLRRRYDGSYWAGS